MKIKNILMLGTISLLALASCSKSKQTGLPIQSGIDTHVHEFEKYEYNDTAHYKACECGKTSSYEAHSFNISSVDINNHALVCACGFSNNLESHDFQEGDIITPATFDKDGIRKYKCWKCDFEKEDSYSKVYTVDNIVSGQKVGTIEITLDDYGNYLKVITVENEGSSVRKTIDNYTYINNQKVKVVQTIYLDNFLEYAVIYDYTVSPVKHYTLYQVIASSDDIYSYYEYEYTDSYLEKSKMFSRFNGDGDRLGFYTYDYTYDELDRIATSEYLEYVGYSFKEHYILEYTYTDDSDHYSSTKQSYYDKDKNLLSYDIYEYEYYESGYAKKETVYRYDAIGNLLSTDKNEYPDIE